MTRLSCRMNWKNLSFFLKMFVTLLFVYLISRKIHWTEFGDVVRNTDFFFLSLAFIINPLMVVVSAWKWHILLRAQKQTVSFPRLIALYYVGYLFNNVMPSNVGGDLVISYELAKHTKANAESIASVFMNRFTGLIVLIFAAMISLIFNVNLFMSLEIALSMGMLIVGSLLFIWIILDKRIFLRLQKFLSKTDLATKFLGKMMKMQEALLIYAHDPRTLATSLLLSTLFFLMMIANIYVCCLAFGVHPSLLGVAVITPFVQVVSMLPISIGGAGLQEWAYIIAFPEIDLSASVGLSVSLLLRLKSIFGGLIGGAIYPLMTKKGAKSYAGIRQPGEVG